MIKERCVSSEVARLLRDKGFDGEVHNWYCMHEILPAPTQAVACDWVEETFNISIVVYVSTIWYLVCICYAHKDPYTASIGIQNDMPDGDNSDGSWSSKELAYNEALKYVLTTMI